MELRREIERYAPCDAQETRDREVMLYAIDRMQDVLTRENPIAHFTASAWIVNPGRDRVLMAWHNIYKTWAWTGGHADGESDLLAVALREAREETGIARIAPVRRDIYSIEVLPVNSHIKRGQFVAAHLHLNATYLLEADDAQPLRPKPDENSAVGWFSPADAMAASNESWFREHIYAKLNEKMRLFL